MNGYLIFKYGFTGATVDNDNWIRRKMNAVTATNKCSMHLGTLLKKEGLSSEQDWWMDPKDYAFHGGCFPIILKGTGLIGTITVSGLPQEDDHQMVVDVLSEYLKK